MMVLAALGLAAEPHSIIIIISIVISNINTNVDININM